MANAPRGIGRVCVIGAGTMGRQIALNTALHGVPTTLFDVSTAAVDDAVTWAHGYLAERVARGRLERDVAERAQSALSASADLATAVAGADLVIEAATEALEVKRRIFADLDRLAAPAAILATNSSTIVSSKVADVVREPGRVANLHYFNPALVMTVVEIVQGAHTAEHTVAALVAFAQQTGKTPIVLKKEIFGFVANRLLDVVTREAINLVEAGYATAEEVDLAAEKALGHPLGPFRLMDLIGLDVMAQIWTEKARDSGDAVDGPPSSVVARVEQGTLGRKTGRGWYEYPTTAQ